MAEKGTDPSLGPHSPALPSRWSTFLGYLIPVLALLFSGAVIVAYELQLRRKTEIQKSELITLVVMHDVELYVLQSGRKWPKSWADLDVPPDAHLYTKVDFELTRERILAQQSRAASMHAIRPISSIQDHFGKFYLFRIWWVMKLSPEKFEALYGDWIRSKGPR